jgi:prolyl oligopeptidase
VKDTYGDTVVADPYRWLEDQESSETRTWIEAQQRCTAAALSSIPDRASLSSRFGELLHTDSYEAPTERGGRYFYRKRPAGGDLSLLYFRRGVNAPEEILIDPLPWSADHSASVSLESVSRDGKFVFYGRRDGGQDQVTLRVLEVDSKTTLPDAFPKGQYFGVEPTPDNKAVYYSRVTPDGPRAFYHRMGDDPAKDAVIFGQNLGKDKILALQLSEDGTFLVYLVIYGSGSEQSEIYVQNIKAKGPILTAVNNEKALFFPSFAGNRLFIFTNWRAPQWRVVSADLATPQREYASGSPACSQNGCAASGSQRVEKPGSSPLRHEIRTFRQPSGQKNHRGVDRHLELSFLATGGSGASGIQGRCCRSF